MDRRAARPLRREQATPPTLERWANDAGAVPEAALEGVPGSGDVVAIEG